MGENSTPLPAGAGSSSVKVTSVRGTRPCAPAAPHQVTRSPGTVFAPICSMRCVVVSICHAPLSMMFATVWFVYQCAFAAMARAKAAGERAWRHADTVAAATAGGGPPVTLPAASALAVL